MSTPRIAPIDSAPSPEAGPSTLKPPTTSSAPSDETEAISTLLASRRRRGSSLRHAFTTDINSKDKFAAYRKARSTRGGEEEDVDRNATGDGDGGGEIWGDVEGRETGEEEGVEIGDDEADRLRKEALEEMERFRREMKGDVVLFKEGSEVDGEGLVSRDEAEELKQDFVWDVLFENQRGVYLFGKAHFSGQTLLPVDPSHYTVPSHPLPSASSFAISNPAQNPISGSVWTQLKRKPRRPTMSSSHPVQAGDPPNFDRPIQTVYSPKTFQLPTPAWEWLTPWMINMRNGTDEDGWRYNAWFKGKGWKSHAGGIGWGGWVRRREMVRLRGTKKVVGGEDDDAKDRKGTEWNKLKPGIGLEGLMNSEDVDENVERVMRSLGRLPLDRQKLETWRKWLDDGSDGACRKLQQVLDEEGTIDTLSKSFTYQSSVPSLLKLFESHNLHTPSQSTITTPAPSSSDPSSPKPDPSSPKP